MEYKIIYSRRKTLSLCVKDGEIIAHAPIGFSEKRIDDFVNSKKEWVLGALKKQKDRNEKYVGLSEEKISEIKKSAKEYFNEKTAYFASIMNLKYSRITITSAKTRFGSCSSRGNISYSWRLMLYPEEAREYVVIHELSHLVHMTHSSSFYKLLETYMPNYKEIKKLLKK